MINYKIFSTIELGFFSIHIWGLFAAIGFLVALYFIVKEAKRKKVSVDSVYSIAFFVILGGLLGARVAYVLGNLNLYSSFLDISKLWEGGLGFFGGFIGAFIFGFVYIKIKKLNFWKYVDIFVIGVPIGHIFGRIGCYLTGLHVGKVNSLPWGILVNNEIRHPVVAYEIIYLALIFLVLNKLKLKERFNGFLFFSYLILYGIFRFFNDFLRVGDSTYYGLTGTQIALLVGIVISVAVIYKKRSVK